MKTFLIAASAAALLVAAAPASAQVGFRADPWGAGAQVGPLEFGVGPRYERPYWRDRAWDRDDYAYAPRGDCRQRTDCTSERPRDLSDTSRLPLIPILTMSDRPVPNRGE